MKDGCLYSRRCIEEDDAVCPFKKCVEDYCKVAEFISENRQILIQNLYKKGLTKRMLRKLFRSNRYEVDKAVRVREWVRK